MGETEERDDGSVPALTTDQVAAEGRTFKRWTSALAQSHPVLWWVMLLVLAPYFFWMAWKAYREPKSVAVPDGRTD